jgi:hypothetical protein
MTFSMKGLLAALDINDNQHDNTLHAESRILFIVILNVILLRVIMLSIAMLSVVVPREPIYLKA